MVLPLKIFVAGPGVEASTSGSTTDTNFITGTGVLASRSTAADRVAGRVRVAVGVATGSPLTGPAVGVDKAPGRITTKPSPTSIPPYPSWLHPDVGLRHVLPWPSLSVDTVPPRGPGIAATGHELPGCDSPRVPDSDFDMHQSFTLAGSGILFLVFAAGRYRILAFWLCAKLSCQTFSS